MPSWNITQFFINALVEAVHMVYGAYSMAPKAYKLMHKLVQKRKYRKFKQGKLYAYNAVFSFSSGISPPPIYAIFLGYKDNGFFESDTLKFLVHEKVIEINAESLALEAFEEIKLSDIET